MRLATSAALAVALAVGGCKTKKDERIEPVVSAPALDASTTAVAIKPPPPPLPSLPLGLPPPPAARQRALSAELVARGAELFSDETTWGGNSCATCHQPARDYTSPRALDRTASGKKNLRHTPTLTNLIYARSFYWDSRAPSIASMIANHARGQLGADVPDDDDVAALTAFVFTRYRGDSAWDRHEAGELDSVSAAAVRGAAVFNGSAGCARCHPPPLYSDLGRHSSAVAVGIGPPDVAKRFKTPSLRAVSLTAPYFHGGTAKTLESAVQIELSRAGVVLPENELADLLAFLASL